jgi:uncharacterized protein YprB with RNaseH-like and TPR domain
MFGETLFSHKNLIRPAGILDFEEVFFFDTERMGLSINGQKKVSIS